MKHVSTFAAMGILWVTASSLTAQNSNAVSTAPVGFVTIDITAGNGTAKKTSLISVPLLNKDTTIPSKGEVTAIVNPKTINFKTLNQGDTGNTIVPDGYLSKAAEPYLIHLTSGSAEGYMLLVSTTSANKTNEITLVDPQDPTLDVSTLGLGVGDKFSIYPCDTLLSFFGAPESTLIKGGATPTTADTIVLVSNGSSSTYFYSTTLNRWTRVSLGSPNANNTPLMPYYGIQYGRLANTPLSLVSVGEVPTGKRKLKIRGNGATLLSTYWPKDTSLNDMGIAQSQNWRNGATASMSDRIVLSKDGSVSTFWNNGTNWKRVALGSPNADTNQVTAAGAFLINKTTPGQTYTTFVDSQPYSF
jgi:hypothetical protein